MSLLLSFIIPTHNRSYLLKKLLNDLVNFCPRTMVEIIVVDNNSSDSTRDVVQHFLPHNVRYIFEENTSFTKARATGAQAAKGDIIVYLDDDIIIYNDIATLILEAFSNNQQCGVVGAKILPHYEEKPPQWILDLQNSFNGYSLYDLGDSEKKVDAVPGPLMAIRKSVYNLVGGFPPDTIGVETNSANKTFKKLYIGSGDYGFCVKAKSLGYNVIYNPKIQIKHMVFAVRLTKEFWLSRMIGEGHCLALSYANMGEFYKVSKHYFVRQYENNYKLLTYFLRMKRMRLKDKNTPLLPDELWFTLYKSLIQMEIVLHKNPEIAVYLWDLGLQGVSDKQFDVVLEKLPKMYRELAL